MVYEDALVSGVCLLMKGLPLLNMTTESCFSISTSLVLLEWGHRLTRQFNFGSGSVANGGSMILITGMKEIETIDALFCNLFVCDRSNGLLLQES